MLPLIPNIISVSNLSPIITVLLLSKLCLQKLQKKRINLKKIFNLNFSTYSFTNKSNPKVSGFPKFVGFLPLETTNGAEHAPLPGKNFPWAPGKVSSIFEAINRTCGFCKQAKAYDNL
jgi:hypothetical protein